MPERAKLGRMAPGDAYIGKVVPGGPPDVRELADLVITKVSVGPHDNNAYLLRCRETGEQLLIDAADDAPRLMSVIGSGRLTTVITTHAHADHWQALKAIVDATGATSVAPTLDAADLPVKTDRLVEEGDRIKVGTCELEVIRLTGHTPGGIALLYMEPGGRPHLFSADSLFPGGVGNTAKDPERFKTLMTDVETKVFGRLPDETWVYPGHGNDTTLGTERPSLPDWWARGW
jgi:glyoxylase-like metal-dependent hydrolase (beta-lactamase superfamily II)